MENEETSKFNGLFEFREMTLADRGLINKYMYPFGQGSCQNSFVSSFIRNSKYHDMYAEYMGFLVVMREGISRDGECVFLFPAGDVTDRDACRQVLDGIIGYAAGRGLRLRFDSLTQQDAELLEELYPGKFAVTSNRDYYEYMYLTADIADLPGTRYHRRRTGIRQFEKLYGDRAKLLEITPDMIPEILKFHEEWIGEAIVRTGDDSLHFEEEAAHPALDNYEALGLSGMCVIIDGELCGYIVGCPLSDSVYDVLICKGNREVRHIYDVLINAISCLARDKFTYSNWEEDLGIEGLRAMKLSYCPCSIMEKSTALIR